MIGLELRQRGRAVARDADLEPLLLQQERQGFGQGRFVFDDEPVSMPLKEFDLLEYLLRNSGRVLTRGQLIDRVWGADYVGDTKTLDVHIKRLRSKIEVHPSHPKHLVTVRGLGYKFEE